MSTPTTAAARGQRDLASIPATYSPPQPRHSHRARPRPPLLTPRRVAQGLSVLLWMIGSAYLVQAEQTADTPNLIVMLATPAIWAAVISIPVLAGHALAERQHTAALLLTLAALLGSAYTLSGTLGRQAEARDTRVAASRDADTRRAKVQAQLDEVERILAASRAQLARECATGQGRNCVGIQTVIGLSETAAGTHRDALAKLGRSAPDAGERRIAAFVAAITGHSEAATRDTVGLILPALFGLLLEVAALALAMYGFSKAPAPSGPSDTAGQSDYPALAPADAAAVAALVGSSTPDVPNREPVDEARKDEVLGALLTDLALGRSAASQTDLCHRFGVARSTMSDWLREWERSALIPPRRTVGRCKSVG